jgi:hypothetical protein
MMEEPFLLEISYCRFAPKVQDICIAIDTGKSRGADHASCLVPDRRAGDA